MYALTEAARLLRMPPQTLRRWLEGTTVKGTAYLPVIRTQPTGADAVTWGEFVEAGFLREYRLKQIPLPKMRKFIEGARHEFRVPYPLAHFRPMIDNRELVYELQLRAGLEPEFYLVRSVNDQLLLTQVVLEFLEKVEFSPDEIVWRLRPGGKESPVTIDPNVAFGIPQIRGIRTELVAESIAAGGYAEAEASWRLSPAEIDAALAFEQSLARAA
jgi:uncharacterized protein (DUF433 family)